MRTGENMIKINSTKKTAAKLSARYEVVDTIVAGLKDQNYSGIDVDAGKWLIQVQASTSCMAFGWVYDRVGNLIKKTTINNGTRTDIFFHTNRHEVDIKMSVTKATKVEYSKTPVPKQTLAKVKDMMATISDAMNQAPPTDAELMLA